MDLRGKIENLYKDFKTGRWNILLSLDYYPPAEELEKIIPESLDIILKKHREGRSLNANALLWKCLTEIGRAMTPPVDKWEIYLQMLRKYGKYTYICVKPNVVEAVKKQWRECEEIGPISINGTEAVQLLCYFGSSTYDTKEFSTLLDGVISEMEQLGLQLPLSEDLEHALKEWEKMTNV